jgi:hypothetical protein
MFDSLLASFDEGFCLSEPSTFFILKKATVVNDCRFGS